MNKPIVLIKEELKYELAKAISESNLPAFVIEPILADFLAEIRMISQKQYEEAKTQYEQYLKAEAPKEKEDTTENNE